MFLGKEKVLCIQQGVDGSDSKRMTVPCFLVRCASNLSQRIQKMSNSFGVNRLQHISGKHKHIYHHIFGGRRSPFSEEFMSSGDSAVERVEGMMQTCLFKSFDYGKTDAYRCTKFTCLNLNIYKKSVEDLHSISFWVVWEACFPFQSRNPLKVIWHQDFCSKSLITEVLRCSGQEMMHFGVLMLKMML